MRLKVAVVIVAAGALFALAPGVATARPLTGSGSVTQTSFTITQSRTVGRVTVFSFVETDTLTGTFQGTSQLIGTCLVLPNDDSRCEASETFTGTVAGVAGTVETS